MASLPAPKKQILIAVLGVLPALILLYGFIPYTYSHLPAGSQLVSVMHALSIMWNNFPDFQHGMLVPFFAGIVIYARRQQLAQIPIAGWAPAVVLVVFSLMLFWAGRRVDNQYVGFLSLQALLGSLVLWLLGWKWLVALAFPLAFLVFTWPMPFLDQYITFPLRMVMSTISVDVLNLFGVATIQNGTGILSAPNPDMQYPAGYLFQVDVANPCSGIRSLFALLMIAALYGYFTLRSPWKRLVLFLSAIPLAVLGNLMRIVALTLGNVTVGAQIAIGTEENPSLFHQLAGYAVFLVAMAGMLLVSALLNSSPRTWIGTWGRIRREVAMTRKSPAATSGKAAGQSADLY